MNSARKKTPIQHAHAAGGRPRTNRRRGMLAGRRRGHATSRGRAQAAARKLRQARRSAKAARYRRRHCQPGQCEVKAQGPKHLGRASPAAPPSRASTDRGKQSRRRIRATSRTIEGRRHPRLCPRHNQRRQAGAQGSLQQGTHARPAAPTAAPEAHPGTPTPKACPRHDQGRQAAATGSLSTSTPARSQDGTWRRGDGAQQRAAQREDRRPF